MMTFSRTNSSKMRSLKILKLLVRLPTKSQPELKDKYNHIEWKQIQGLRHVLVHDYYMVNPQILWNTKNEHLPDLLIALEDLMEKEAK